MITIEDGIVDQWAWIVEYGKRNPDLVILPTDIPFTLTTEQTIKLTQRNDIITKKQLAKTDLLNIPAWATWTRAEFSTWCSNNLMTDAQIDALTLGAALKTNLKANNAFTRNGGKMLLALRDTSDFIQAISNLLKK